MPEQINVKTIIADNFHDFLVALGSYQFPELPEDRAWQWSWTVDKGQYIAILWAMPK